MSSRSSSEAKARAWRRAARALLPSAGALRLSVYFTCVCLVLALLAARSVRADIGEAGLAAGRQLSRLEDLAHDAEILLVNGERLHHSAVYVRDSVPAVLDRFELECARDPGFFARVLRDLPKGALDKLPSDVPRASRNAVVRDENGEGGMVACFVDAKPGGLRELKERLQNFFRTRDLSEFGKLRYAYAARKGDETRVITLWAETGLNLGTMFPASGDAAGADSPLGTRPPEARRVIMAAAEGMPFALRTYESRAPLQALEPHYDRWAASRGFSLAPGARAEGTSAYLDREGRQVFVSLAAIDGKSFVTVTEAAGAVATAIAQEGSP